MILYLQRSFIVCCLYDIKILFIHLIMNINIVFLGGGNLPEGPGHSCREEYLADM